MNSVMVKYFCGNYPVHMCTQVVSTRWQALPKRPLADGRPALLLGDTIWWAVCLKVESLVVIKHTVTSEFIYSLLFPFYPTQNTVFLHPWCWKLLFIVLHLRALKLLFVTFVQIQALLKDTITRAEKHETLGVSSHTR